MVWRLILVSWALAVLSIAAFYWFGPEPPPPAPEPAPEVAAPAPEPAKPPEPPPKPRAADAGPMVVVVGHRHVARLDERGWTTSPEDQLVFGLQFGSDGGVWTGDHDATFRRHGDAPPFAAVSVPQEADRDGCTAFLPTAAHELWIACRNTVHRYHDGPWTVDGTPRPADDSMAGYGGGAQQPVALAQDARGRLWLARRGRLEIRHEMGGWDDVAIPEEAELVALAPGPGGSMYVLTRDLLLNYPDFRRRHKIDLPSEGPPRHERLAVSDRGNIVVLSQEELDLAYTQALGGDAPMDTRFDWVALTRTTDGEARRYTDARDISLGRAEGIAIDDNGRVWWTSVAGLAIVDGDRVHRWWRGAVPELLNDTGTGVGALTEIVVGAGGPALPIVDEATPTPVRGRVLRRGQAKAGLTVEICRAPRARYRRTPCQDQRLHFTATTDARGGFTVADVPPGEYGVVIEQDGRWANAQTYFFVGKVGKKPVVVPTIELGRVTF